MLRRRPSYVRPLALTVVAAALAVSAVACGGGGSSSGSGGSTTTMVGLAVWSDRVNDLCLASKKKLDELPSPESETDFTTLASSGEDAQAIVQEFVAKVKAVGTPAEKAVTAKKFLTAFDSYGDDLGAVVTAAKAEDADRVNEGVATLDEGRAERDDLATQLGVPDCVGESADDSSTSDGSGTDTSGNLEPAAWSQEVNAACSRLEEKYTDLQNASPSTPEEAVQLASDVNAFATEIVGEWERIGPPAGDTARAQALYDEFVALRAATTKLQNAAAAGDANAIDEANGELEAIGQRINPLATELDVPACGGF